MGGSFALFSFKRRVDIENIKVCPVRKLKCYFMRVFVCGEMKKEEEERIKKW